MPGRLALLACGPSNRSTGRNAPELTCRPAWPCWDPRSRSGRSGRRGGSTRLGHSNFLRSVDAQLTSHHCRPPAGQEEVWFQASAGRLRTELRASARPILGWICGRPALSARLAHDVNRLACGPSNEVADRNAHKIKSPEWCIGPVRTLFSIIEEECDPYLEFDEAKLILDLAAAIRQAKNRQVALASNVQTGTNNSRATPSEQVVSDLPDDPPPGSRGPRAADDADACRRCQAARRQGRHHVDTAYVGLGHDPPPAGARVRARRRVVRGWPPVRSPAGSSSSCPCVCCRACSGVSCPRCCSPPTTSAFAAFLAPFRKSDGVVVGACWGMFKLVGVIAPPKVAALPTVPEALPPVPTSTP